MPHLSDHDLRQFDETYLETLTLEQARALLGRALSDLKTARERLAQNPSNSSRPPSSRAPWERSGESTPELAADSQTTSGEAEEAPAPDEEVEASPPREPRHRPSGRPPGRRPGAKGHSRTQQLPVDVERSHAPTCCAGCTQPLTERHLSRAHNARYELELIQPGAGGTGLVLQQTKHTYLERQCACGHWTRAEPGRCED